MLKLNAIVVFLCYYVILSSFYDQLNLGTYPYLFIVLSNGLILPFLYNQFQRIVVFVKHVFD